MALLSRSGRARGRGGALRGLLTASVLWASQAGSAWADKAPPEYAVKAAYLYKFAPFVEWPPRAFTGVSSPFVICVIGQDPFGAVLDEAVRGQRVDGRTIQVRRIASADPAGCQILFIGRASPQVTAQVLRAVAGQALLTVSDERGDTPAMIQFVVRDGRVRFRIDAAAAEANGLPISSKLLGLALSVRR